MRASAAARRARSVAETDTGSGRGFKPRGLPCGAILADMQWHTAKEAPPMRARIYRPARTATQSGTAKTHDWLLEFSPEAAREVDPLMGWTGSGDMNAQVRLRFDSREAAEAYARERGIDYVVTDPKPRRPNIRPRGYGENFATDRRGAWTH
jgi:NADH dehydrogenase